MPEYDVKVTFTYPVGAVDAEDALLTVPEVIRMRLAGVGGEGQVEISDRATKAIVLTAAITQQARNGATVKGRR